MEVALDEVVHALQTHLNKVQQHLREIASVVEQDDDWVKAIWSTTISWIWASFSMIWGQFALDMAAEKVANKLAMAAIAEEEHEMKD